MRRVRRLSTFVTLATSLLCWFPLPVDAAPKLTVTRSEPQRGVSEGGSASAARGTERFPS